MSIMHDIMYPPINKNSKSTRTQIHKKAEFEHEVGEIFYCPPCNRCWEKPISSSLELKNFVEYIQDFPTIGKERKVCHECKNLRVICDLCDKDVPRVVYDVDTYEEKSVVVSNIVKRKGVWICNPCDKKYPEDE